MKHPQDALTAATPLERLVAFTKKLIAVPKDEIDAKSREYQKQNRAAKRKRRLK